MGLINQVNLVIIYLQTKEIEKRIKKIYKLRRSHRYCGRNHPCTIDCEISCEMTCKMTVVPFTCNLTFCVASLSYKRSYGTVCIHREDLAKYSVAIEGLLMIFLYVSKGILLFNA
jgi:hypothetical protein